MLRGQGRQGHLEGALTDRHAKHGGDPAMTAGSAGPEEGAWQR